MKKLYLYSLATFLTVTSFALSASEKINQSELEFEAQNLVKEFSGILKPRLKEAIGSGGFIHAIEICSVEAPKITNSLSEKTGWQLRRISLKARNSTTATPDSYERKVLEKFNLRQENGESAKTISHSEIVDNEYRFLKAQGVEAVCLNCHGESVSPEIKAELLKKYPEDIALGYSAGQIRGAISLVKALPNSDI